MMCFVLVRLMCRMFSTATDHLTEVPMMIRNGFALALAIASVSACLAGTRVNAGMVVYDFENQAATSNGGSTGHPGSLTSLSLTTSGLTMTLTRQGGTTFDVVDTTTGFVAPQNFPASFGNRSLDPFSSETSSSAFVANFFSAVSSFSLQYGDFGGDSDVGTIQAFSGLNGTGTMLASATDTYGAASLPSVIDTFGVTATGIESVVFIAGSTGFPNSVYYDNITVTPASVPEPTSLLLSSIAGLLVLGWRRSKRLITHVA
jgi:PEP-CTERM motif